jgi:hypothetical protein
MAQGEATGGRRTGLGCGGVPLHLLSLQPAGPPLTWVRCRFCRVGVVALLLCQAGQGMPGFMAPLLPVWPQATVAPLLTPLLFSAAACGWGRARRQRSSGSAGSWVHQGGKGREGGGHAAGKGGHARGGGRKPRKDGRRAGGSWPAHLPCLSQQHAACQHSRLDAGGGGRPHAMRRPLIVGRATCTCARRPHVSWRVWCAL